MSDAQHERMRAVKLTLPVMCGYLFLGTASGAAPDQAQHAAEHRRRDGGVYDSDSDIRWNTHEHHCPGGSLHL